jgi:transposase
VYTIYVLEEKDKRIAELEGLLKSALEEIERLKNRIAQLEKNSGNSSKPPSSDIIKPVKTQKSKRKRKIGAQKGHKQNLRIPFNESQINEIVSLTLETCPKCGGTLKATGETPIKHQQVELVEKPFFVKEYHLHRYWCKHCQCYHETKLEKEVERAGLFGQDLIALTAYMKSRCHMSYTTIQSFFADVFSLKVSTGFLVKQVRKASEAIKPAYDNLVKELPYTKHIHSDETGFKENGELRWIWCFRCEYYTVFYVASSRGSTVLNTLLGIGYMGIISSDFFSAYRKFKGVSKADLQFCWAHLIREVKFIAENGEKKGMEWGKRLLEQIREMFLLYNRRDRLQEANWRRKMLVCKEGIIKAFGYNVPINKEAQNLSKRMHEWHGEYFGFIESGVPPTNNASEQSIRRVVIDRKITQGTRSEWGNQWSGRIWSVLSTCDQRGENVMLFLRSCVGSFLRGISPPLFPIVESL